MKTIPIYATQNVDRIIRSKDYDSLDGDQLRVTSFFRTIQGEGPHAGRVAVFLRLAGCNFGDKQDHCAWCDTDFGFDSSNVLSFKELTYELTTLPGYSKKDILVITGGEPTLQTNLVQFLFGMNEFFQSIQIETNGTQTAFYKELDRLEDLRDRGEELDYVRPMVIVSPKASLKAGRYAEPSPLVRQYAHSFKFVLSADPNDPHHTVPDWALASDFGPQVYVSPMAVYARSYQGEVSSIWEPGLIDHERTAANYRYAGEYAMKHNLRVSIQQHLFLALA